MVLPMKSNKKEGKGLKCTKCSKELPHSCYMVIYSLVDETGRAYEPSRIVAILCEKCWKSSNLMDVSV